MIWTIFDLIDSAGNQLYTRLHVSPAWDGFAYDGEIITKDTVIVKQFAGPVGVPLVPNSYIVQGFGRNADTRFNIALPIALDNTTQSAVNFITMNACDQVPTSSYAFSASFAATGPGTVTYATASNLSGSAPTSVPGFPQFYQDTSNSNVWYYNIVTPAWVLLFTV